MSPQPSGSGSSTSWVISGADLQERYKLSPEDAKLLTQDVDFVVYVATSAISFASTSRSIERLDTLARQLEELAKK